MCSFVFVVSQQTIRQHVNFSIFRANSPGYYVITQTLSATLKRSLAHVCNIFVQNIPPWVLRHHPNFGSNTPTHVFVKQTPPGYYVICSKQNLAATLTRALAHVFHYRQSSSTTVSGSRCPNTFCLGRVGR